MSMNPDPQAPVPTKKESPMPASRGRSRTNRPTSNSGRSPSKPKSSKKTAKKHRSIYDGEVQRLRCPPSIHFIPPCTIYTTCTCLLHSLLTNIPFPPPAIRLLLSVLLRPTDSRVFPYRVHNMVPLLSDKVQSRGGLLRTVHNTLYAFFHRRPL